ncbi:MAG TPA: CHAT domain-containing protein [Candidatus Udaeobacter sp.]|nr:CHAT domain-containing protein [Candidatus Udaeobacter sp.]
MTTQQTILFLAANPNGVNQRAFDREMRSMKDELKRSGSRDFKIEIGWAAGPLDLLRDLREHRPTVVHFNGHGGDGGLYLQDNDGDAKFVSTHAIQQTFGAAGDSVKVVVLNSCYSDEQAEALIAHVDCVVGMSGAISDAVTRQFAIGFYGGLGERESVAAAYAQGKASVSLAGLHWNSPPQLKVRHGVDANRLILARRS